MLLHVLSVQLVCIDTISTLTAENKNKQEINEVREKRTISTEIN